METQTELNIRPYNGEAYLPIPPQADNEILCDLYERVILRHNGCGKYREAQLTIAPKGMMVSGWVIGVQPFKQ